MMRSRQGFTLIELLTVMTIILILASIGIPKLQSTKERAIVASMIADLRTVTSQQEAFFANNNDYAGGFGAVEVPGTGGAGRLALTPSPGNIIDLSWRSTGAVVGWRATVRNPGLSNPASDECGSFVGDPSFSPNAAVIIPAAPTCY
ncbi:MAG: prepilin-type N-terminal cleavage/methylation domain-containing protein [Gemmatimonadales bacterium]|nr:prepilin-type N-terminal cleavage/methylation domain-containing protein [Gemmatimonadales bacterium]